MANGGADEDMDTPPTTDDAESDEPDDDEDGSGEYVDEEVISHFKKEYEQAQHRSSTVRGGPSVAQHAELAFRHRPVRRAAQRRDDGEKSVNYSLLGPVQARESSRVAPKSQPAPQADTLNRWKARAAEEARPHSFASVFWPTSDDVARWRHDKKSPQRIPWYKAYELTYQELKPRRMTLSSGRNNIVEEYMSPDELYVEDFQAFKGLTDAEKQEVIQREAEEYGLEKPKGYTVSFHYNPHVEYHHFGSSHPMKPWRLTLTKQLIVSYGLEYTMDIYQPRPASFEELAIFHDREYLSFIQQYVPVSFSMLSRDSCI